MAPNRTIIIEIKGHTVRINDPDFAAGMQEEYAKYQQDLINEWRNGPTALIDIPMSDEEIGDIAYYNSLVQELAKNAPFSNVPIGKQVI